MANKEPAQNKNEFFVESIDWETSRIQQIEQSERRAWGVALAACLCVVMLSAAFAVVVLRKEIVPFVVRVDNTTGYTDVVNELDANTVSQDEVLNKYWLSRYIHARETYNWQTLQDDYNAVKLLSIKDAFTEYAIQFEGKEAIDKKYGNNFRATVDIVTIVPHAKNIATVRFVKTIKRTDDVRSQGDKKNYVATVNFEYRSAAVLSEKDRLVNPLGFQVRSYRVDSEMAGGEK